MTRPRTRPALAAILALSIVAALLTVSNEGSDPLSRGLDLVGLGAEVAYADDWNVPPVNSDNCTKVINHIWSVFNFRHACQHHDRCYYYHSEGGGFWGRWDCDYIFLQDMLTSCGWWNAQTCVAVAFLYWHGVRMFGAGPFAQHSVGATWAEIYQDISLLTPGIPHWLRELFEAF